MSDPPPDDSLEQLAEVVRARQRPGEVPAQMVRRGRVDALWCRMCGGAMVRRRAGRGCAMTVGKVMLMVLGALCVDFAYGRHLQGDALGFLLCFVFGVLIFLLGLTLGAGRKVWRCQSCGCTIPRD
jgi:hypothetical protein